MKKLITSLFLLSSLGLFAQDINIPDSEFLTALTSFGSKPGNQKVDTNGDGKIQENEAEATVELLYLSDWKDITDLTGIEAFTNLKLLVCSQTNLASLDISMLPNLEEVVLINNKLASLKVHPNLQKITCSDNAPLTGTLDLSQNTNLNYLVARNTSLTKICLPSVSLAIDNPNSFVKDVTTEWSDECVQECIVDIPDANFKSALINHSPTIDTNNDGEIQCGEAEAYTGGLGIREKEIKDLTGIEYFTNITTVSCALNQLTEIDLSNNTKVTHFWCEQNLSLKSINVLGCTDLIKLWCYSNQLTTLNISNNPNLQTLYCGKNKLEFLDISNNLVLETLDATGNPLSQGILTKNELQQNRNISQRIQQNNIISFKNYPLLDSLNLSNTGITNLNLTHNTNLSYLKCDNTDNLTTIYVPSIAAAESNENFIKDQDDIWTEIVLSVFENEVTTRKHIIKAYNLQGTEVPINTKGQLIILLYSDGTTHKFFGK